MHGRESRPPRVLAQSARSNVICRLRETSWARDAPGDFPVYHRHDRECDQRANGPSHRLYIPPRGVRVPREVLATAAGKATIAFTPQQRRQLAIEGKARAAPPIPCPSPHPCSGPRLDGFDPTAIGGEIVDGDPIHRSTVASSVPDADSERRFSTMFDGVAHAACGSVQPGNGNLQLRDGRRKVPQEGFSLLVYRVAHASTLLGLDACDVALQMWRLSQAPSAVPATRTGSSFERNGGASRTKGRRGHRRRPPSG